MFLEINLGKRSIFNVVECDADAETTQRIIQKYFLDSIRECQEHTLHEVFEKKGYIYKVFETKHIKI